MKFFKNIPKKTYTTPVGDLSLVNFYAFYKKNLKGKRTTSVNFDNKSTLIEASVQVFDDKDSLWAFLHSNNKINPFKLNKENAVLFLNKNENKITFGALTTNSGTYPSGITLGLPVGSLLIGYTANSGESWSYSSVGNFDLNGPFSIIEKVNSYNRTITVKETKNDVSGNFIYSTANDIRTYRTIYNGDTYYVLNNDLTNKDTGKYKDSIEKEITPDKITITDGYFTDDEVFVDSGNTTKTVTIEESITTKQNILQVVSPFDLAASLGSLIVPKYSSL